MSEGEFEGTMPKARILAVDDQLYFRVYLEDLLREEGYEVSTAKDAEEALQLSEREDFDVIVTDLVMPGLDGCELVQRVKERRPEQEIVVVTSVGDVKTAVDAMKLGASEYLLKPLERTVLVRVLDGILQRRRMRDEHDRLVAENLEFMGAFSLYERALGLFSTLSVEALADRIVEGLCLETNAHGGVLWLARNSGDSVFRLVGVRGLVRVDDEPEQLDLLALPPELAPLEDEERWSFLSVLSDDSLEVEEGAAPERPALYVPLRRGDQLLGVARLTDRVDGGEFGDAQRSGAERFSQLAVQAVENALQFRALERRSFRDPLTKAYTRAFFDDVAHAEIRKATRFGRTFSVLRVELEVAESLRSRHSETAWAHWLETVVSDVSSALRGTDLLAAETEVSYCVLLPETDALGSAVLKRRIRLALERSDAIEELSESERPEIHLAAATFPTDASQLEGLFAVLAARIDEDRRSLLRSLELEATPFRGLVDALLAEGHPARAETGEQMTRFLLDEVGRRPRERGLLFIAPGASMAGAVRDGLESLRGLETRTEIVLVADRKAAGSGGLPGTWVSPLRTGTQVPFLIYYGEGPPYAMIREEPAEGGSCLFHTADRVVVEQLAFQLGRDLGIPVGE